MERIMKMENKIKEIIYQFCLLKGVQTTNERINLTAAYLAKLNYGLDEIIQAITDLAQEIKCFPDVSDVIKKIKSQKEISAVLIANDILGLAGAGNYKAAQDRCKKQEYWEIIEEFFGSWKNLSELSHSDITRVRPQLRDYIDCKYRKFKNHKKLGEAS